MPAVTALFEAAAGGDEQAWNALVKRYGPTLRRIARSYRLTSHDADDVAQACWEALIEHADTLREPEAIGAWLATTARRKALRVIQHDARELLSDSPVAEGCTAPDGVEAAVLAGERSALLRDAVRRLPGRQRTLLEALIDTPDPSYTQISAGLGIPLGSIGPTRERGLRGLREDERFAAAIAG